MKILTSSIPGIVLTPNLFSVFCSLLSSVEVVLWTAFFFLHITPSCELLSPKTVQVYSGRTALQILQQTHKVPSHSPLAAGAHGTGHLHESLPIHLQR